MWALADQAADALSAQVQTYAGRADLLSPTGALLTSLNVTDGSVELDVTATSRRSLSGAKLVDPTGLIVPRVASDLLDPRTRNQLRIWRAIVWDTDAFDPAATPATDGTTPGGQWVPLGTFQLGDPEITEDDNGLLITISSGDISGLITDNSWTDRWPITTGTNLGTAILNLLADRAPNLKVSVAPTTFALPYRWYGLEQDSDPWKDVQDLAAVGGWRVVINPMGEAVAGPIPDPAATPVSWRFVEGAGATAVSYRRQLLASETYNGVILNAESAAAGTSFTAFAWDTDPNSPTYYLGTYGKRPKTISLSGISTQADSDAAAAAQWRDLKGMAEGVSFDAVPNPALDGDDCVNLARTRLGIGSDYIVQTLTQPIGSGLMSVSCRQRRY